MTNTRRGHDTERKCAQELKALGYDVIRSAASKSIWDIIAVGPHDIRLIQCKRTKKNIRSAIMPGSVMLEMHEAVAPRSKVVRKELWTWVDRKGWTVTVVI